MHLDISPKRLRNHILHWILISFEAVVISISAQVGLLSRLLKPHLSFVSKDFYDKLAYFSAYGPHMQRVTNMYYNSKECLLSLRGSDATLQQYVHYS